MSRRWFSLIVAVAMAAVVMSCSSDDSNLEQRVKDLEDALGTTPTSNATPNGISSPQPSDTDYQLTFLEVQSTVNSAGFGLADALIQWQVCETDLECGDAMLLVADEYEPYVAILGEQIAALDSQPPPADWRSLHNNYLEQLTLRKEAGELWILGVETGDIDSFTQSDEKFRESQLLLDDILDDVRRLSVE